MHLQYFLRDVGERYQALFGYKAPPYDQQFLEIAQPILALIAEGDAPYHTIEHTLQVIGVGQSILEGKQHYEGTVSPHDWLHMLVALLLHDVGYVKGACEGDRTQQRQYCDGQGGYVLLPSGATGAALMDYHVARGQACVADYLANYHGLDLAIVQWNIEMTRFPVPDDIAYADTASNGGLCRAADLLGQLSDPQYLAKLSALFREFEETGMNQVLGYSTPTDLRASYPNFYRHVVQRYIQPSLRYLGAKPTGRKVIARLYTNLRLAELAQPPSDTTTPYLTRLDSEAELLPWQGKVSRKISG